MAAPAQTTEGLPLLLSVTRTARLVGVSVRAVNGGPPRHGSGDTHACLPTPAGGAS